MNQKRIENEFSKDELIFLADITLKSREEKCLKEIFPFFLEGLCRLFNFPGSLIFFLDCWNLTWNLACRGKLEETLCKLEESLVKNRNRLYMNQDDVFEWCYDLSGIFQAFWQEEKYGDIFSRSLFRDEKEILQLKILSCERANLTEREKSFIDTSLTVLEKSLENILAMEAMEKEKELAFTVGTLTDVISTSLSSNTENILKLFLEKLREFIDFDQACIAILNKEQDKLGFLNTNENMEISFDTGIEIPIEGTVSGWIVENERSLLLENFKDYDCFSMSSVMESSKYFQSCIGAPLYTSNRVTGAFTLWNKEKNSYTRRELLTIKALTGLLTIAINGLKVYLDSRKRSAALSALMQVGETLSSTMDLDRLSRSVIEELDKVISIPYAGLYLYDEEKNLLHLVDAKGLEGEERKISQEDMMSRHPGWVIKNKKVLLSNDTSTDERIVFPDTGDKKYDLPGSVCYVPMLYHDRCFGIIGLASKKKNYFTDYHVKLVTAAARHVAIAFSRASMYEKEREMVNKLKEVNKMKDEFIANVSHELRTPLTAVIGFSYLLKGGKLGKMSDMQLELLNDILTSAQNMLHLVEDLLDLSKLQAKKIKLLKKYVNLKVIVEEVITTTRIMAQDVGVSLESSIEGDFTRLYVDPNRMRQVILNLVTNAIKFNVKGGYVKITLQDKGEYFIIKVSDSGVGISREDQPRVFEQFRQVGAGSSKFRGTGLGLAITKQLIELHRGEISLESEPGKGSTFTIILPREEGEKKEVEISGLQIKTGKKPELKQDGKVVSENIRHKILLVEDDKFIRKMISSLFKDKFDFVVACDGIEGVEKALRHEPDLILMDLALPYMNGYETTKIIKSMERTAGIPVIALTARVTEAEMDKAALCSFDRIINKPFDPDRLVTQILDFLGNNS